MAMSDPVADVLTRIRNAQSAMHDDVEVPVSKLIESILNILKVEGFIGNVSYKEDQKKRYAKVILKYYEGEPVIRGIQKVSKPGRRIYLKWKQIFPTLNNIGLSIISTPKGMLSGKEAKFQNVGGEYICKVW